MASRIEADWVQEQRRAVADYLEREGVRHGEIGAWPAWHVRPYLAIWAIESATSPGRVGLWGISGDCPTDHMSSPEADHPRAVMRHFARAWTRAAEHMLRGEEDPELVIGTRETWPELGDLLLRRALLLRDWADDETLWTSA